MAIVDMTLATSILRMTLPPVSKCNPDATPIHV
jgi:hypothetical protein